MFPTFVFSDVPYFLASSEKRIWNVEKNKYVNNLRYVFIMFLKMEIILCNFL